MTSARSTPDQGDDRVRFMFSATLIDAPKDMQAAWCIQQVMDHLELSKAERLAMLRYMVVREEGEEVQW